MAIQSIDALCRIAHWRDRSGPKKMNAAFCLNFEAAERCLHRSSDPRRGSLVSEVIPPLLLTTSCVRRLWNLCIVICMGLNQDQDGDDDSLWVWRLRLKTNKQHF